ncbi:MAG: type III PLP-dependent enzyme [Candidatus Hydrogenedentota bacterium]|nr:MAG: type III PLP-dependent enzyme [Candidatus Hydrogenedentota bacterium]
MGAAATPVLLMDRTRIRENYRRIKNAFPNFQIAYAIKANPHDVILQILHEENSSFETASIYEIRKLLDLGIPAEKIIYSNPVKPTSHIEEAVESGISIMSFDSLSELNKFKQVVTDWSTVKLLLRIQVPNPGSLWPLSGKFGAPFELCQNILQEMAEQKIPLAGFTFHVGSQAEALEGWREALRLTRLLWQQAISMGLSPNTLNIGGGFPIYLGREVPSIEQIADCIFEELRAFKQEGIYPQHFIAEPGRYISGSAGTLLAKVIGVAEREDGFWAFLDCGVFSGMMETIDGIEYPILTNASGPVCKVTLCGPSCDSVDKMFQKEMPLPKEGDNIYFVGAGAYTTVYASQFNGYHPPQLCFVDEAELFV